MAFNTAAATNQQTPANEAWKAQGFLNLYLPNKAGGRRKLGAIPLKNSKPNEKDLLAWLNEDPERVSVILSKLIIEFQSAEQSEATAFDLV